MAKVCIYGVGAIGGLLAARLALAGEDVSGIARGAQLAAIEKSGLTLIEDGQSRFAEIRCVANTAELGVQDVVFLTVKSHQLASIVDHVQPLLGAQTSIVTVSNGLPWWMSYGTDRYRGPRRLENIDPSGRLWSVLGPERAIGCVIYPAAFLPRAGAVNHVFGNRFTLGEPDGSRSSRVLRLAEMFGRAGFEAPIATDIRIELWIKLLANSAYNPVNILAGGNHRRHVAR